MFEVGDRVKDRATGDIGVVIHLGEWAGLGESDTVWTYWPKHNNNLQSKPDELEIVSRLAAKAVQDAG